MDASLDLTTLIGNSFCKSGETISTLGRRIFLAWGTIIDHFCTNILAGGLNPDQTMFRAAMSYHVGCPFAHHPGEDGISIGWTRLSLVFNSADHPRSLQDLTCAIQFAAQGSLPVSSNSFPHLVQC